MYYVNMEAVRMKQLEKVKIYIGGMSNKAKIGIVVGVLALVAFAFIAATMLNEEPQDSNYATLFSELGSQEASEVMAKLQETGVDYQYRQNGEIAVPADSVDQIRATLAVEGYPKDGFAYGTYLDNTNLLSTEKDKQLLQIYEAQDRLQATIRMMDGVQDAVVQLSIGEDNRYVLSTDDKEKSTASVMVVMKDGGSPTKEQVIGIQRLVAKSVVNMEMGDVAVIDGNGLDVTVTTEEGSAAISDAKLAYEEQVEQSVQDNILHLLEGIYGRGNVRVSVKASAEMGSVVSEQSEYTAPNIEENAGYVSNQTIINEGEGADGAGGVPGTGTNTTLPQYNIQAGAQGGDVYSNSYDTDYLLNQTITQSQNEGPNLRDLTVAISINTEQLGINADDLTNLVGDAAGIERTIVGDKITIVNSLWPTSDLLVAGEDGEDTTDVGTEGEETEEGINPLFIWIGIGVGVLLLILIIVLLILRRRRKKRKAAELEALMLQEQEAQEALLASGAAVDENKKPSYVEDMVLSEEEKKAMDIQNKIRSFAEDNPEISAQLLKSWLKGGE